MIKSGYNDTSKSKSWTVPETVLSHLNDWSYVYLSFVPIALNVPFGFASGNVKGFTKAKLTVSFRASRYVLIDG